MTLANVQDHRREKPKAVITGGTGFLGQSIAKFVKKAGAEVFTFDTSPGEGDNHYQGSILSLDEILAAVQDASVVYHIAGVLGTTELLYQIPHAIEVNVIGTANVLEACRLAGVRRVFYPSKPNEWLNAYSITKKAGEDIARLYGKMYGMDVRILRWLNAYGPHQKLVPVRKAVPTMIVQALAGRNIEIWGTGRQPVDLIYTSDLAEISAMYTLTGTDPDQVVRDTGRTVRMEVNELAELIIRRTGSRKSKIVHLPMRAGEYQETPVRLLESQTAASIVGLSDEPMPIEEGMDRTIDYYRSLPANDRESALDFYSRAETAA